MTHLATVLPKKVELGAKRRLDWNTEIVTSDSGTEVRNNRWANPLRTYEVTFPVSQKDNAFYLSVMALYEEAMGNLHSFDFTDWVNDEVVPVRFDGPLVSVGVTDNLEQIVEVTLVEVRIPAP